MLPNLVRTPPLRFAATAGVVTIGTLMVQASIARRREYLPRDPGFTVDVTSGETDSIDGASATAPLEVALVGDSLVAGVGASTPEASLGGQIAAKVAAELGRPVRVVGHGVSGAVTRDVLDEQLELVRAGVDAIVIEIGSNDVTHMTRLGQLARDTQQMLRRALELAPIVVLGSGGVLDSPNFNQPLRTVVVHRAAQVRAQQRKVAALFGAEVSFMDVSRDVAPAYDAQAPHSTSRDLFHPSDLGYEIWARPLAALLASRVRCADRTVEVS